MGDADLAFSGDALGAAEPDFFSTALSGFAWTGLFGMAGAFLLSAMDLARDGLPGDILRPIPIPAGAFAVFAAALAGFAFGLAALAGCFCVLATGFAAVVDLAGVAERAVLRCAGFFTADLLPVPEVLPAVLVLAAAMERLGAVLLAADPPFFAFGFDLTCLLI